MQDVSSPSEIESRRCSVTRFQNRSRRNPVGQRLQAGLSLGLCGLVLLIFENAVRAQAPPASLADVNVEQLMDLEVTSVSGRARKVSHTASAIFVITAEDIRRSGATSIPEALRLAPGLQVAQINDSVWAIGSRGFGTRYANKLQVLVDGRSLYTVANGGVNWNMHNLPLDDIERIEVVRGPGASFWGGNAVNGVINIITRHSRDTQGALLTTAVGSQERVHSSLRYGMKLGRNATLRVSSQFVQRDSSRQVSGESARDGGDLLLGGVRMDWNPSPSDEFLLTANLEDRDTDHLTFNFLGRPLLPPVIFSRLEWRTGSVMSRWQRYFQRTGDLSVQWSYDWASRQDPNLEDNRGTMSLDFRHHVGVGRRQNWLWGFGYNRFNVNGRGNANFAFGSGKDQQGHPGTEPFEHNVTHNRSVLFGQNEIALVREKLFLIPAARLQHELYSGFTLQPNLRAIWIAHGGHSIWGAISLAVRTPTEVETHSYLTVARLENFGSLPAFLTISGNQEFKSERLMAYELGYRAEPRPGISFDVAAFVNAYHDLLSAEPGTPFFASSSPFPRIEVPLQYGNKMDGKAYGVELDAQWKVNSWWALRGSYSRLEIQLHPRADSRDTYTEL